MATTLHFCRRSAGGDRMFAIQRTSIDPRVLESAVKNEEFGAVVTFMGVVRAQADDGREVTGLSYEAYEPMALAQFERIADEARARFGRVRLAMAHRVGDLAIGEIAVVVVSAAVHRAVAFESCAYAIDRLKARAAIWKKEHYTDGDGEWIANTCTREEAAGDR